MKFFYSKLTRITVASVVLFSILISLTAPLTTHAMYGIMDTNIQSLDVAPTSFMRTMSSTMQQMKSFVLDRLAYIIAKQILHQITASVISWINSGFKGSPSFVTNPGAFFTDVADQVTGAFIQDTGILKGLCSPFSLDLRLSLALNQVQFSSDRYKCTFKTIVQNARNADITLNGKSIKGFVEGNFSKGGWPAFITMTTSPQNNAAGAWLMANDALKIQISQRKTSIKADISIGQGFMNFEKCVPAGNIQTEAELDKFNSEGSMGINGKNEICHTETPGSVIAGKLMKNVNSPETQLELANDINAIISALVSQLVTQLLGGLLSMSKGSATKPSYVTQLFINSSTKNKEVVDAETGVQSMIVSPVQQYKSTYDTAVNTITDTQTRLNTAKACLVNTKIPALQARIAQYQNTQYYSSYLYTLQGLLSNAQANVTSITNDITKQLTPMLNDLKTKQTSAGGDLQSTLSISGVSLGTASTTGTSTSSYLYPVISSGSGITIATGSPTLVTAANTFTVGTPIQFSTTGTLPVGMSASMVYYVITNGLSSNTFEFSDTENGAPINTSGSQSGIQTVQVACGTQFGTTCYNTIAGSILDATSNSTNAQLQNQLTSLTSGGGTQAAATITANQQGQADTDLTAANKLSNTLNTLAASAQTACDTPIPAAPGTPGYLTPIISSTTIATATTTPSLNIDSVTQTRLGTPPGSAGTTVTVHGTGFTSNSTITLTSATDATVAGNPPVTAWTPRSLSFFVDWAPVDVTGSVMVSDGGLNSNEKLVTVLAGPGSGPVSP